MNTPRDIDPRRHVHDVVRQSGSSFQWGMHILPKPRRDAMYAIYAFCREVDDITDEPGEEVYKRAQLQDWRAEIDRLYGGHPTYPTARALLGPVQDYNLPREEFLTIIDGMETDAGDKVSAPSMDELLTYCRRVAGAVGMLSIHAFGTTRPPAPDIAVNLGNALQLTNILRDIYEDAQRDRLYLPRELLENYAINYDTAKAVLYQDGTAAVCAELAHIARDYFAATDALLAQFDWRLMRPAVLMMEVYRRTLDRLEARGWDKFREPVRVSRPEKLWVAFRYSLF